MSLGVERCSAAEKVLEAVRDTTVDANLIPV